MEHVSLLARQVVPPAFARAHPARNPTHPVRSLPRIKLVRNRWQRSLALALVAGLTLAAKAPATQLTWLETHFNGTAGIEGLSLPTDVLVTPDGGHVIVAGAGANSLVVFARDAGTGELQFLHRLLASSFGVVLGLAAAPSGAHVYAVGLTSDQLSVVARDPVTGALTVTQVLTDGVDGVDGLEGPRQVEASADGLNVYTTASTDGAVAVFATQPGGDLVFLEAHFDGVGGVDALGQVNGLTLSPDGLFLYAASPAEDAIAVFARGADGRLQFVGPVSAVGALDMVADLAISPDGHFAVAVSQPFVEGQDWLALFARDAATGLLSFRHELPNPPHSGGCRSGPGDPAARVEFTADGRLFATNGFHQAIAALAVDSVAEQLVLRQFACDGVDGVKGLSSPADAQPSPDGRHLYATGFFPDALVAFAAADLIFGDGFESGDTSAWSSVQP